MISAEHYHALVRGISDRGYDDDVAWAEGLKPPPNATDFATELIYVICNSGMKFTIARKIFGRVMNAVFNELAVRDVFGHAGKAVAIERIWRDREVLFGQFNEATDKVEWLGWLPWIGPITKYHAAKNFGVDCVKPDVHLARLATIHGTTPHELCAAISRETGHRIATVDTVIWRACAIGLINSKTGGFA